MMSSDSNMPVEALTLLGSIMKGTVRFPLVRFAISSDQPNRALGQGLYSTVRSNMEQASLTLRLKGDASYSYMIRGFDGRLHLLITVELSLNTPKVPGHSPAIFHLILTYFFHILNSEIVQPSAVDLLEENEDQPTQNTPVPSLKASATPPVKTPPKSPSATVSALGSGTTKSFGGTTFGVDFFKSELAKGTEEVPVRKENMYMKMQFKIAIPMPLLGLKKLNIMDHDDRSPAFRKAKIGDKT